MNTIFLATDFGNFGFSGSAPPLVGADESKLLDYRLDTYWMTNTGSNQTLSISHPAGETFDAIGIVGQNFDETGGLIVFEGSLLPDFSGENTASFCTFSASSDPQVYTFGSRVYQYLRLRFEGLSTHPRIAQLCVGRSVSVAVYSPPFRVENIEANTIEGVSLGGRIRTSRVLDPRVRAEVQFDYLTDADRSAVANLVETTRGKTRPFFFRNHEGVTRFVRFAADYQPSEIRGHNLNTTQVLIMRTQETSGLWNLQGPNATGSIETWEPGGIPDSKFVISVS